MGCHRFWYTNCSPCRETALYFISKSFSIDTTLMKGIQYSMKRFMPLMGIRPLSLPIWSSSRGVGSSAVLLIMMGFFVLQMIFVPVGFGQSQDKQDKKSQKDGYYLGLSSYQERNMALAEVARLKEQGYHAFYQETGQGKETKFRVMTGPYATKSKANTVGDKLKEQGLVDRIEVVFRGTAKTEGEDADKNKENSDPAVSNKAAVNTNETGKVQSAQVKAAAPAPSPVASKVLTSKTLSPPAKNKKDAVPLPETAKSLVASEKKTIKTDNTETKKTVKTEKKEVVKAVIPAPLAPAPHPEIKPLPPVAAPEIPVASVMPEPPYTPRWAYFDMAISDFQKGRYAKARPIFQDILGRREIGQPWRELAERRLADCQYFLKESNSNEVLAEIGYQYKNILFKYPDVRYGNDLAYWRLGQVYKALALYVEAADAYKSLLGKYPGSPLAEEGLYQMGEIFRLDKKYPQAVEALQRFYAQYPGSALSRMAVFALADTYYRMGRSQEADNWYNNALQRWPDLYGLPDGIFLNTGYHFYNTGNYRKAFQVFSYFYSLYPKSPHAAAAARAMAQSLAGMNQAPSAVRLLSTVLAREADKKEAMRTRLLMADLGSGHPGARTSVCFRGVENYREPLLSCDQMLTEQQGDALTEEILYQKGRVLKAMNYPRETFDTYALLLRLYPKSRYGASCRKDLEATRNALVSDYYQKGDHLAVADLYFTESGFQYHRDTDVLFKVADSLQQLGFYREAAKTFQDLKNTQAYGDPERLDLAIAEAEMKSGKIREAQARLVTLLGQKRAGPAVVKNARRILADSYYLEKNFDGAIEYYAGAMPFDRNEEGTALALYRYADALKRRGQGSLALQYFHEALNTATGVPGALSDALKGELFLSLGEGYFAAGQYEQGITLLTQSIPVLPKGSDQRWALFRLTGGYIKTNNPDLAEKSSGRVKDNTDDPFWAKMADYGLNDGLWFATYEDFLK
jgi:tetratricopeptide (TPR) repeat protein